MAVAVVALLAMAGLVVDGGAKVRAMQRADRIAAEAGRAAGQQIDLAAAVAGERPRVDVGAARDAAIAYLRRTGVSGHAMVSGDRRSLTVSVSDSTRTVFLPLIGVDELAVTGSATVELVPGVLKESA